MKHLTIMVSQIMRIYNLLYMITIVPEHFLHRGHFVIRQRVVIDLVGTFGSPYFGESHILSYGSFLSMEAIHLKT